MSGRLAIWLLAFLVSLAVHSALLAGLLGIAGTAGPPAAAELLIGDDAAFSALVVNPVAPETGLVEKIAGSKPLAPVGNLATATNEAVKKEIYAPAEEAISQPLPRIAQEDSSAPVQAPEALAPVTKGRVETKAVAGSVPPMPDAQAVSPASDQPRVAREAAGSNRVSPTADDRRLAGIADHRELLTPSPAFEPKQVQGDKEINSAEQDAIPNSPVMAELASPTVENDRLPSVAESQTQPGQSPEQEILAPAAESAGPSAPVESGVEIGQPPEQATSKAIVASEQANAPAAEEGARQTLPAVAEAFAPEKIGSAQSLAPAAESTGATAPVESGVEIGQPREQATSKAVVASEQANAPVVEDGARQNLPVVAEAFAPEKIGSAQSLAPAAESTGATAPVESGVEIGQPREQATSKAVVASEQANAPVVEDGARQNLPAVAEAFAPEKIGSAQSLAPAAESTGATAPVESGVEIGQPREQATSKAVVASEQANAPAAEDDARQNLPAVAEAFAPEKIGSAQSLAPADESTQSARLESEAPRISAVPETAGQHVASIATGGEHERPGLAVGGGHTLKAAEAEDRPIAPTETNSPIHVPVEPTATQSPFSLPDSVEPQPQAASTIVAQAAPHPAIELPPTHVLPDDPTLRMANFIRDYDGGFCFLAAPDMLSGKPQIEAYGSRFDLFRSFNEAFRRAFGVDPVLGMRQIREPQCAAIGFIGKVLKSRSPEIAVRLESDSVPSGSEVKGALEGIRLSHVTLLFVDDDGMVHDVSRFLRRTVDGFEFSAPVYPTREGKLRNQLVVAVAADRKLGLEKTDFAMSGSAYFSSMVRQADASGAEISIGVGAFRIE